jgi:hypothetical protein
MRLAFLVLAAAINPVFAGDLTQSNQLDDSRILAIPTAAPTNQSGGVRLWYPGSDSNHFIWHNDPTNSPATDFHNRGKLPAPESYQPSAEFLPPGVYKTSPYTLLVCSPGWQHDDSHIGGRGTIETEKMPIFRGGLKFTPFKAEK